MKKPKLYFVLATAGDLEVQERLGFLQRFKKQIEFYKKEFDVEVLSADKKNYSRYLGVRHRTCPLMINKPLIKHIMYALFLIISSISFKKGVIKTWGTMYPSLPFMKIISRNPIVSSYHYDWIEQEKIHHNVLKWLVAVLTEKLAFLGIDFLIPTTERLQRKFSYRNIQTEVVPNFVDNSVFYPSLKKKRQIVYIGRLVWYKGVDILLKAVSMYDKSIKLFIIGSGSDELRLKKLAKSLLLKNTVFTGSLDQNSVASYLRESYALILPTITMEGHPKVIIESLACGTPCIVTDVLGSREIIKNGYNGLVVQPKDAKQLSAAIKTIFEDNELRKKLSENAIKESRKYYIKNVMRKEMKIIKKLANS